jgi:hypothetical protein
MLKNIIAEFPRYDVAFNPRWYGRDGWLSSGKEAVLRVVSGGYWKIGCFFVKKSVIAVLSFSRNAIDHRLPARTDRQKLYLSPPLPLTALSWLFVSLSLSKLDNEISNFPATCVSDHFSISQLGKRRRAKLWLLMNMFFNSNYNIESDFSLGKLGLGDAIFPSNGYSMAA